MLYCTLNWSRLHNFIHDILLRTKAICWSHTIEVSTQNCLGMGWRLAASCKKVWPLRQSTPFQEPWCCCIWIARFIYHSVKASDIDVTETKFLCRRNWDGSPRYDHVWALHSQRLSKFLLCRDSIIHKIHCNNIKCRIFSRCLHGFLINHSFQWNSLPLHNHTLTHWFATKIFLFPFNCQV